MIHVTQTEAQREKETKQNLSDPQGNKKQPVIELNTQKRGGMDWGDIFEEIRGNFFPNYMKTTNPQNKKFNTSLEGYYKENHTEALHYQILRKKKPPHF